MIKNRIGIWIVIALLGSGMLLFAISDKNSAEITLSILGGIKNVFMDERDEFSGYDSEPLSHNTWTNLLKRNVLNGLVDYQGFISDSLILQLYLNDLSKYPPGASWTDNEKKAYWINAYNAYTVKLIIDHYPVSSIKEIAGSVPFVNSPWDLNFFKIGDKSFDLNTIEHEILRKKFNDPRIHFAINCASISCPNLRNEAYEGAVLERQLNEQAVEFINDPSKNDVKNVPIALSKVFYWFQGDFKKETTLLEYINQFVPLPIDVTSKVDYMEYNWALNSVKPN